MQRGPMRREWKGSRDCSRQRPPRRPIQTMLQWLARPPLSCIRGPAWICGCDTVNRKAAAKEQSSQAEHSSAERSKEANQQAQHKASERTNQQQRHQSSETPSTSRSSRFVFDLRQTDSEQSRAARSFPLSRIPQSNAHSATTATRPMQKVSGRANSSAMRSREQSQRARSDSALPAHSCPLAASAAPVLLLLCCCCCRCRD